MDEQVESKSKFEPNLHNHLPIGQKTEAFLINYPNVRNHFEDVGCRVECCKIGEYPRLVLIYPGLHHSKKDRRKSIDEFWGVWANMPIRASMAQITYPDHTFVPDLMYSQIGDLIEMSKAKEVDIISFSFGGPFAIQQIQNLSKDNPEVKVRSLGLIISGLEGDDLTPVAQGAGRILDKISKVPAWLKIPSNIDRFSRGLGGRLGNISEQVIDPALLPKDLKVLLMLAKKDALFDSDKIARKVGGLYPEAKVVWLPGGHGWNEQKTKSAGLIVQQFLSE